MRPVIAALFFFASLTPAATRVAWKPGESAAREAGSRLAVANSYACAVPYDGTVRCWGSNSQGELGDGTTTPSTTPVTVRVSLGLTSRVLTGVVAVTTAANDFSCALTADGKVFCWGKSVAGQLGNGDTGTLTIQPFAKPVAGVTNAVRLIGGTNGACALLANGTLSCWGLRAGLVFPGNGPAIVPGVDSVFDLASGFSHDCILQPGGVARCFGGSNAFGELGNGQTGGGASGGLVVNLAEATSIAAADDTTCAVVPQGQIRCWGRNHLGQLGNGNNTDQGSPQTVLQINNAVAVDGGEHHFCALTATGLVKCWGSNNVFQLGHGLARISENVPVDVPGLSQVIAISAASHGRSTCAMKADGSVSCWGANQARTPQPIVGLSGGISAKAVVSGGTHTCAIRSNGTAACWGENGADAALLGNGSGAAIVPNPTTVNGLANVTAITAGVEHTCVLIADGSVKCWGRNGRGQIGNSTAVDQPLPVDVPNVQGVAAIQAGSFHTCAIQVNGNTFCWGANESGQLAIQGDTGDRRQPNLILVPNIVSIATGRAHTCATRADGSVSCWGAGALGQMGNGGTTATNTVAQTVPGLTGVLAIETGVGSDHTCSLDAAGAMKCWGRNDRGQIGTGVVGGSVNSPTPAQGLATFVNMAAPGALHTCVAGTDGLVRCWGGNTQGQVGAGRLTFRNHPLPEEVAGVNGAQAIVSGINTTCAQLAKGALECWGNNATGQVGDGTSGNVAPAPVDVPSFPLNIVPTVLQSASNPRKLTVNIVANCEEGDQLKLSVQVRQASTGAAGHGNETTRCKGGLATFPVEIQAQGGTPFSTGAATVEADAEIRGADRTTQSWTRAVNIVVAQ